MEKLLLANLKHLWSCLGKSFQTKTVLDQQGNCPRGINDSQLMCILWAVFSMKSNSIWKSKMNVAPDFTIRINDTTLTMEASVSHNPQSTLVIAPYVVFVAEYEVLPITSILFCSWSNAWVNWKDQYKFLCRKSPGILR